MNLITRLRTLEAKIYAADAHEAHKYVQPFLDELAQAAPFLLDIVDAVQTHEQYGEERTWKKVQDALDALEGEV